MSKILELYKAQQSTLGVDKLGFDAVLQQRLHILPTI